MGILGAGMAASALGSVAGNAIGGGSSSRGYNPNGLINQMNGILQKAQDNAINSSTQYNNKAVDQLNTSLPQATGSLNQYLQSGISGAQGALNSGLNQYQNAQAPYAGAGYGALDAYMNSLGLATPKVGSQQVASSLQNTSLFNPILQNAIQQGILSRVNNGQISLNSFNQQAPTLQQFIQDPTANDINSKISSQWNNGTYKGDAAYYEGVGRQYVPQQVSIVQGNHPETVGYGTLQSIQDNQQVRDAAYNNLLQDATSAAQNPYQQALQAYQQQQNAYNTNLGSFTNGLQGLFGQGFSPEQLAIANTHKGF